MVNDPFTLTIAVDNSNSASGDLYVDDGNSFEFASGHFTHRLFKFDGKTITNQPLYNSDNSVDGVISVIKVTGLKDAPTKITKNTDTIRFTIRDGVLTIKPRKLHINEDWELTLEY